MFDQHTGHDPRLARLRRHRPDDVREGHGQHRGGRANPDWTGRDGRPLGRGFGRGFGPFGHGPAVRRGEVRPAILAALADQPMHGYQVMQELRERSGGAWAPSAGSIYPTLQLLEDEGLVQAEEKDGRRVFSLTEAGRAEAARATKVGSPWDTTRGREAMDYRSIAGQVMQAAMQVAQVGSPAAVAQARALLVATRRDLYQLLATDDRPADEPAPSSPPEEPTGDR
jgi:DNA-binding PadR family transcriptional regulator